MRDLSGAFPPDDHVWSTADVAAYLCVENRKVGQTVQRWGVPTLLASAYPQHVGGTSLYRAEHVVAGRMAVRNGRYAPPTTALTTEAFQPEAIATALRIPWPRKGRRLFLVGWPRMIGMSIHVHPRPRDGIHHVRMRGEPMTPEAYRALLAAWLFLDLDTGELRASAQLVPHREAILRGLGDIQPRV